MKVLIAGGGTAGHINPGLAIAKYIQYKKSDANILFVGTQRGMEKILVPREGFELQFIRVMGFQRKILSQNMKAFRELFRGLKDAYRIVKEFKPDIVIGTGGYVCGPVLLLASMMKIPTLIHEQNAFPGVTNRILSRFVDSVAISFKESAMYFSDQKKLVLTGNPIRSELLHTNRQEARERLGILGDKPFVAVFGGSRGAEKINQTMIEMLKDEYQDGEFEVLFASGEFDFERVSEAIKNKQCKFAKVVPYIFNMADVMTAADLLVARAGAMTVSEIAAVGVPSILIPSPHVTANHQEHNARVLESQGAAIIILEKNISSQLLYQQMKSLLSDKEQLVKMGKFAKKVGNLNAVEKIYSIILEKTSKK